MNEWWKQAACSGLSDLFLHGSSITARRTCMTCSVKTECLDAALDEEQHQPIELVQYVRGGLFPSERRAILRDRRSRIERPLSLCGSDSGYHGHRERGEQPCTECKSAHAEAERGRQARRRARQSGWVSVEVA
jgi:hypothetical protein